MLACQNLKIEFNRNPVIKDVSLEFPAQRITAIIGPSGCGKSTLLRAFNRMHDLTPGARVSGTVTLHERDIYHKDWIGVSLIFMLIAIIASCQIHMGRGKRGWTRNFLLFFCVFRVNPRSSASHFCLFKLLPEILQRRIHGDWHRLSQPAEG